MATDNHRTYSDPEVVKHYSEAEGLQPAEGFLFQKYLTGSPRILDIGVGGGRTTRVLSPLASRYLGIDYSEAMIEAARAKFPELELLVMNAADMATLESGSFDCVVFSHNGMDYLPTDQLRGQCLREIRRVLRPGGILLFSAHNSSACIELPNYSGANAGQVLWRTLRAFGVSLGGLLRAVRSSAFWRGRGYVLDSTHGGLLTRVGTPGNIKAELKRCGFDCLEWLDGRLLSSGRGAWGLTVAWYYYAARVH